MRYSGYTICSLSFLLTFPFLHAYVKTSETTLRLEEALAQSDVVITGVPSTNYKLPATNLKDGVIAVNFSTFKNMDVDVQEKASVYVGSVGKVTVAMLQRNLFRLYAYAKDFKI